jgi:hypothetical protein
MTQPTESERAKFTEFCREDPEEQLRQFPRHARRDANALKEMARAELEQRGEEDQR